MNTDKRIELLEDIELELSDLIRHDRKNWVRTAKLLLIIERDKLFEVRDTSFTGYIRKLAYNNRINTSTLWRIKSAATLFMELSGITDLNELQAQHIIATPEQLEIYRKVRSIVPEKIMDNLKERLLAGKKVRNELNRLWETYKPLKKGKTERGRKKRNTTLHYPEKDQIYLPFTHRDQEVNTAISQHSLKQLNKDLQKIDRFELTPEDILKANMLNALRSQYWMENTYGKIPLYRFKVFQQLILRAPKNKKALKVDCMSVSLSQKNRKQIPEISAVLLTLNEDTLLRIKKNVVLHHYCNYAFVAMPHKTKLEEKALSILPEFIGILAIKDDVDHTRHAIKTIRLPKFNYLEDIYANTVHRAMLLRSLQWNNIEKPEAV